MIDTIKNKIKEYIIYVLIIVIKMKWIAYKYNK
jgi:hypothetical protein